MIAVERLSDRLFVRAADAVRNDAVAIDHIDGDIAAIPITLIARDNVALACVYAEQIERGLSVWEAVKAGH